jgi:hypothetical protein
VGQAGAVRRAVGARGRVMSHLAGAGEITDPGGMASAALARAIGYPGSSVAFAQLLSAMERSGLIERDIRGKRTYRIAATHAAVPGTAAPSADDAGGGTFAAATGNGADFDYDDLARRLLARILASGAVFTAGQYPAHPAAAEPEPVRAAHGDQDGTLEATVARLERKLADVRVRQRTLTEENARLTEQIRQVHQSLAAVRERASRARAGEAEAGLLIERLLASLREREGSGREAGTG